MNAAARTLPSLDKARRIVIKVGSSLLVDSEKGTLRAAWLNALVDDIASLRAAGRDVLVVSSGDIALGRRILGIDAHTPRLAERQAAAAARERKSAASGKRGYILVVHGGIRIHKTKKTK